MTDQITYKINDTKNGMFATVNLPEGTFTLTLTYQTGMNNRREWTVKGDYPEEKYMISYEGGELIILKKGGDYENGQIIEHKAFGKGTVMNVYDNSVTIDFENAGEKTMLKSILKNFLK